MLTDPSLRFGSNPYSHLKLKFFLVCNKCYESEKLPKDLKQSDFEFSNFFTLISQFNGLHSNESKILIINYIGGESKIQSIKEKIGEWTTQETILLIEAVEKNADNWDEVVKVNTSLKT